MRFPAVAPHHSALQNPSFIPINTTITTAASNFSCNFEPTSVLDLRRSPSPVQDLFLNTTIISDVLSQTEDLSLLPSINEDLHHQAATPQNLDDWDSIMRDLGLHDDFAPSNLNNKLHNQPHHSPSDSSITQFSSLPISEPHFSQSELDFSNWNNNISNGNNTGFDYVEELIRAVGCFDSGELQLAHILLSRLNNRLRVPAGKPLQRASFYFKEALNSLLSVSTVNPARSTTLEIVESIRAHKAFSSLSPIPMFADFTADQAVLESISASATATFLHIIDFEIGLGGKYASLLREISERSAAKSRVSIRITAIVPEEFEKESRLVSDNLSQFAHDVQIRFRIDVVSLHSFEMMGEKAIEFSDEERTVVHLSPATLRRTGSSSKFVADLRLVCPSVVILVTSEEWMSNETVSFRRSFVEGLEFYSLLLESLDAAGGGASGGGEWVRRIEAFVLRGRITEAVEAMGAKRASWREVLGGAGMRAAGQSRLAEFQAECLVRKGEVRGWNVGSRQGELVLSWKGRPLVATSVWRY